MGNKVFVGNLSFNTTTDELRSAFESCGKISAVALITDRETGQSRGFGFVTFASDAEAAEAIRSWNGASLGGRTINVNEAREKETRGGGGAFSGSHGGGPSIGSRPTGGGHGPGGGGGGRPAPRGRRERGNRDDEGGG